MRLFLLRLAYLAMAWLQFFWTTLVSVPVECLDLLLDDLVRKLEVARLHAQAMHKVRHAERGRRRG